MASICYITTAMINEKIRNPICMITAHKVLMAFMSQRENRILNTFCSICNGWIISYMGV